MGWQPTPKIRELPPWCQGGDASGIRQGPTVRGGQGGALEHEGVIEDQFEESGRRRAHRDVAPHGGACGRRGTSDRSMDRRSLTVKEWSTRIFVLTWSPLGC
jgi:hypothetical protein